MRLFIIAVHAHLPSGLVLGEQRRLSLERRPFLSVCYVASPRNSHLLINKNHSLEEMSFFKTAFVLQYQFYLQVTQEMAGKVIKRTIMFPFSLYYDNYNGL